MVKHRRRRTGARVAGGITGAVAALVALAVVPSLLPQARDDAVAAPVAAPAAPPVAAPVRILPLGDSITYGFEFGSYRTRLWDLLHADGHEIDFVGSQNGGPAELPDRDHEGHSGWRIAQMTEQAADWVTEQQPDIVLVHAGTNDLIQGASAAETASELDSLVGTIIDARPGTTVVVATLIPLRDAGSRRRQTNAAFADVVAERAAAGQRVLLADMADGGPRGRAQIPDGVHPDGDGYRAMAEVWYPVVAGVLSRMQGAGADEHSTPVRHVAHTVPDARCRWYAAAIRLAGSLVGVTDGRATGLLAELERQGITAGSEPPPGCGDTATDAGTDAGQDPVEPAGPGPIEVSPNGRFLQFTDGRPFFWLADTGWELFHRASREDARRYLDTRAEQGFTVVQAVALAEKGGLDVPTPAGHTPLVDDDPARPDVRDGPDNDYWDDVEYMIDHANARGLYVALWAAWGSMVHDGPEVLDTSNARAYGEFLGRRFGAKDVVFVLGGDRESHAGGNTPEVWTELAAGIRAAGPGGNLISFHPWGEESSTEMFPNDSDVIDFNLIQGSHKKKPFEELTRLIVEDYGRTPVKPVIDSEVFYEEHPFNWDSSVGWKTAVHARGAAYYQVFSGAAGHTYGNGAVHQFWEPGMDAPYEVRDPWYEAIHHEGATQMRHLKTLMLSRSYFDRIPDQDLITSGRGRATRSAAGTWAMVYLPEGGTVGVDTSRLAGDALDVTWFDPRTGQSTAGEAGAGETFTAPDDRDWVLILDALR